jgi:hypothetical protein
MNSSNQLVNVRQRTSLTVRLMDTGTDTELLFNVYVVLMCHCNLFRKIVTGTGQR